MVQSLSLTQPGTQNTIITYTFQQIFYRGVCGRGSYPNSCDSISRFPGSILEITDFFGDGVPSPRSASQGWPSRRLEMVPRRPQVRNPAAVEPARLRTVARSSRRRPRSTPWTFLPRRLLCGRPKAGRFERPAYEEAQRQRLLLTSHLRRFSVLWSGDARNVCVFSR